MALSGDLATFDLTEVFEWLGRRGRTGELTLRRLSTEKHLGFDAGHLCSSSSNDPRETLGQVLVRDEGLSEEDLFRALLRQERERRLLGEILVGDGRLTAEQLRRALQTKTEETVYEAFLWPDGQFEFQDRPLDNLAAGLDMDLGLVVQEGTFRRKQWLELRPRFPASATFKLARRGTESQDPADQQLLALAAAGKTLAAISLESRRSEFETTLRLHALLRRGALQLGPALSDDSTPLDPVGAIKALLTRAQKLLESHSFDGALQAYEAVLAIDGLNQSAKKGLLAVASARREWRTLSQLPIDSIPVLKVGSMALTQQSFDSQEGFVLSRINGQWSLRAILKLCPLPEADVLAIVARLVDRGVVEFTHSK